MNYYNGYNTIFGDIFIHQTNYIERPIQLLRSMGNCVFNNCMVNRGIL